MRTKKIVADTMPLALKMVRQQLGENAIIVNTRVIKTGGIFGLFAKQKYEVTAYSIDKETKPKKTKLNVEGKDRFAAQKENSESGSSYFHKQPQKLYQYYSEKSAAQSQGQVTPQKSLENERAMLDELQHLRKMMMNMMMSDHQGKLVHPALTKIIERLKKQGVEEEVMEYLISSLLKKHQSIKELEEREIRSELISIITEVLENRVPKSYSLDERTRMINVIGPTGVGKTTTIAKLATEQVLKQKRKVAMITTDVYRIAAVEQLKTYAGILNVPIEVVRSADELTQALENLKHYDLIYMDTTGRNYKEAENRAAINEFIYHPPESDNYLVLSLTTKYEDMQILLQEFLDSPVQKLILTKFDETTSYGSILNIAFQYRYQIAYITNGQSVPEDISMVDAAGLAKLIIGEGM
ncbi:hypothetical protein HW35_00535 [Bacillus sp. X1(2014)]|jgi:flagellar biosynthesis protein FlhF|nr:hypothetical protein HW35_00535 [Bacillus sp. X1(2014)]